MTGPTKPRLKVASELLTVALVALACLASSQAPEQGLSYQEAQNLEAHGRFDEAARAYRALLEQDPNDPRVLNSLGVVLARQSQYRQAIAVYQKALDLDRRRPQTQLNLGLAYFKMGDFGAAVAPLEQALALSRGNLQARTLLGMALYGAHRYREAATQLEQASREQPP